MAGNDIKHGSFKLPADTYNNISKIARWKGCSFNSLLQQILHDYINQHTDTLKIIEHAESEIEKLGNKGGDDNG